MKNILNHSLQRINKLRARNKGFALPAAIFFIVIVLLIVTFMAKIQDNQISTFSLGLQSSKAYFAASSGIEWAAYIATTTSACPTGSAPTVNGFSLTATCTKTGYAEGSSTNNVFKYEVQIKAESGTYGSTPDYVSRLLSATFYLST
ncbi:MAG: hypothetical protein COB51_01505 [Moraxellaceae bacterium]|nr:MAG: hypothetical protein COB51_01505 [Moraxellaceae bacterium]